MFSRGTTFRLQPFGVLDNGLETPPGDMKSMELTTGGLEQSPRMKTPISLGDNLPVMKLQTLIPMDEFLGKTAELDESRPYSPGVSGRAVCSVSSKSSHPTQPSHSLINYIPTLHGSPRMPGKLKHETLRPSKRLILLSNTRSSQLSHSSGAANQLNLSCLRSPSKEGHIDQTGTNQLSKPPFIKLNKGSSRIVGLCQVNKASQNGECRIEMNGEYTYRASITTNTKRGSLSRLPRPDGDLIETKLEALVSQPAISIKARSSHGSFKLHPVTAERSNKAASSHKICINAKKAVTVLSVRRGKAYRLDLDDEFDNDASMTRSLSPTKTLQASQDSSPRESVKLADPKQASASRPRLSLVTALRSVKN